MLCDAFESFKISNSISSSNVYALNENQQLSEFSLSGSIDALVKDSTILNVLSQSNSSKKYMIGLADRSVNMYTKTGNLVREIPCDFEPVSVVSSVKTSQEGVLLVMSNSNDLYIFDLYSDSFIDALYDVSISPLVKTIDGKKEILVIQKEKNLRTYLIK